MKERFTVKNRTVRIPLTKELVENYLFYFLPLQKFEGIYRYMEEDWEEAGGKHAYEKGENGTVKEQELFNGKRVEEFIYSVEKDGEGSCFIKKTTVFGSKEKIISILSPDRLLSKPILRSWDKKFAKQLINYINDCETARIRIKRKQEKELKDGKERYSLAKRNENENEIKTVKAVWHL